MLVITTVNELVEKASAAKGSGKSIGLVPTMGALHDGHLSLIRRAREENDVVFVSIFVNPVQFNNQDDLVKYPRTLDRDLELIGDLADFVFAPSVEEVFPTPPSEEYHFGPVEEVMEGAARPGHFNGVGVIVGRLLRWVNPDKAYFGEKDYQQIAVIRELKRQIGVPAEIVCCPIVREANGLAMSSLASWRIPNCCPTCPRSSASWKWRSPASRNSNSTTSKWPMTRPCRPSTP